MACCLLLIFPAFSLASIHIDSSLCLFSVSEPFDTSRKHWVQHITRVQSDLCLCLSSPRRLVITVSENGLKFFNTLKSESFFRFRFCSHLPASFPAPLVYLLSHTLRYDLISDSAQPGRAMINFSRTSTLLSPSDCIGLIHMQQCWNYQWFIISSAIGRAYTMLR